jgi:hypothetical protein
MDLPCESEMAHELKVCKQLAGSSVFFEVQVVAELVKKVFTV